MSIKHRLQPYLKDERLSFIKGKILSSRIYPEFFSIKSNERVINIGCGSGPQAVVYAGQYHKMIGIDINKERLSKSEEIIRNCGIQNYITFCSNVEKIPLFDKGFDKAIAIDIIEHVQSPKKLCLEANRLLKENGELLITFPAMHDKFMDFLSSIKSFIIGKNCRNPEVSGPCSEWNPDEHNHEYHLEEWINLIESCGFKLQKSRATTMFPPLHLYGFPRFWFSNETIHKIDNFFCKIPSLKKYGQTLACVFLKNSNPKVDLRVGNRDIKYMSNREVLLKSEQIKDFTTSLPEVGPFGKELLKNFNDSVKVIQNITSFETAKKAELHENYTDIFLVKEGEEEFFIGGEIIDKELVESSEWRGEKLEGARKYNIKAGDIVIIPKGVPHRHGVGQIKMVVLKIG